MGLDNNMIIPHVSNCTYFALPRNKLVMTLYKTKTNLSFYSLKNISYIVISVTKSVRILNVSTFINSKLIVSDFLM